MIRRFLCCTLALLFAAASAEAAIDITVAPQATTVANGNSFTVRVEVQAGSTGVTVASGYLNFDTAKLDVISVAAGGSLGNVLLNRYNESAGTVDCSAGNSFGVTPPTGTFTLCTITFGAAEIASPTVLHFNSSSPRVTNAYGESGADLGTVTDGTVMITASAPTPTRTNTSPPAATPTPAPAPACCGDCNGDGIVTTAEYNLCRDISLGSADISVCPACSCTGNGQVMGTDLVQIVNNSASGCPQPTPVSGAPWAVNPKDREAVAFNALSCRATGKPCLRLLILSGTPTSKQAGDFWCEDTGSTHKCCYATGASTKYCWTAN